MVFFLFVLWFFLLCSLYSFSDADVRVQRLLGHGLFQRHNSEVITAAELKMISASETSEQPLKLNQRRRRRSVDLAATSYHSGDATPVPAASYVPPPDFLRISTYDIEVHPRCVLPTCAQFVSFPLWFLSSSILFLFSFFS